MPPKRRSGGVATNPSSTTAPASKTARPSKLAKEHDLTAAEESEIKEAFALFSSSTKTSASSTIPTSSVRRALLALGTPPSSSSELKDILSTLDPEDEGEVAYEHFLAVAALRLHSRSEESVGEEVEKAFELFLGGGGNSEGGKGKEVRQGRIGMRELKRVCRELKEEVSEDVLRDMILEANGGAGVGKGVGMAEFEGVMRRAGIFR
ncbi:hypothetical protein MMC25_003392 [Agyrium rufum]|nr:hypothetical protein [Agyrium rufum]